ncbi:uncharacterized protein LOC111695014 [Eurytemora carolleeae]|uniref:uncharacterized protein LOC111695014 n=1 Tax=Eurytemora carolleeae TaxID=1294199 RepID=UPI000C7951B7|nr:uncharacterized protein LOC111695014 [Eurytemora carolleeae]|eukprot:XP_023319911.1 uncharacterized protein LOC111695014 [Eurytemora affinis]
MFSLLTLVVFLIGYSDSAPQKYNQENPGPMPYEFSNRVSKKIAEPEGIYWTQDESASQDNPGRVEGSYSVWQPDGRLMTVSYYIDGDSGFVPTFTYTDGYVPNWDEED